MQICIYILLLLFGADLSSYSAVYAVQVLFRLSIHPIHCMSRLVQTFLLSVKIKMLQQSVGYSRLHRRIGWMHRSSLDPVKILSFRIAILKEYLQISLRAH